MLLTGDVGVGKTTVLNRVVAELPPSDLKGFVTREIRQGGRRVGFRIHTLGGEMETLAHVDFSGRARVGAYGVDIPALNEVVRSTLQPAERGPIYIVDEIGPMECMSHNFVRAVERLLTSGCLVVATVASRGTGLIEQIKRHPGAVLREVTPGNREMMPTRVLEWIETARKSAKSPPPRPRRPR